MKDWIENVISSKKTVAVPVMTHPGIELIGRSVKEACCDGQVHYEAIKALAEKYPTAAATVIMDLTVEAEAFGAEIHYTEDAVPAVVGHMLSNADDIRALRVPSLREARVPQYLKANLLAKRAIADRPVLAGCIGPFSLAGRLYDMSEIMVLIYQDPDAAHMLLSKCTEFILKYCRALKATGADGVVMAEPAAGLMSDEDCRRFSSDYVAYIVREVQDEEFGIVLHNIPFRQQMRYARGHQGCAVHGACDGQPRPRVLVQGGHARDDVRQCDEAAPRHEGFPELRPFERLRHAAPHADGKHRRLLQGAG